MRHALEKPSSSDTARWHTRLCFIMLLALCCLPANSFAAEGDIASLLNNENNNSAVANDWTREACSEGSSRMVCPYSHKEQGRVVVILEAFEEGTAAYAASDNFQILYEGTGFEADRQTAVSLLMDELARRLKLNDKGLLKLEVRNIQGIKGLDGRPATTDNKPSNLKLPFPVLKNFQIFLLSFEQISIWAIFFLAFAGGLILAFRAIKDIRFMDRPERRLLLLLAAIALLLRLVFPERSLEAYGGYWFLEQAAASGDLSGMMPGSVAFYRFLFSILPDSGASMLYTNIVIGWLTILSASLWLERYTRKAYSGAALIVLLGLNPFLIAEHNSLVPHIPGLFFFFAGLNQLELFRRDCSRMALTVSVLSFMFAIYCMPLMAVAIPLTIFWSENLRLEKDIRQAFMSQRIALLLLLMPLLLAHLLYLSSATMRDWTNMIAFFDSIKELWPLYIQHLPFFQPQLMPLAVGLLTFIALFTKPWQLLSKSWALLLCACGFSLLYFMEAHLSGVAHPDGAALYFATMPAALTAVRLFEKKQSAMQVLLHPALWGGLLLSGSIAFSAWLSWQTTNADAEKAGFARLASSLPDTPIALALFADGDPPLSRNQPRSNPVTTFNPPRPGDRILNLQTWWNLYLAGEVSEPSYVYLGTRCYALYRQSKETKLPKDYMHPACRKLRGQANLEPVWQELVPNRPDGYGILEYPEAESLQVGLYKVTSLKIKTPWEVREQEPGLMQQTETKQVKDTDKVYDDPHPF